MGNVNERYLYFLLESNKPVYIKEKGVLDIVKKYPHFEINDENQESFLENLSIFLSNNNYYKKVFLIVDAEKITADNQKRLSCLVKDGSYQLLEIADNCKIVVTGNKDCINEELLGLLVLIDV